MLCMHLSVDRIKRIFDFMSENYEPGFEEVAEPVFKNVKLVHNKSIPKIKSSQFFLKHCK